MSEARATTLKDCPFCGRDVSDCIHKHHKHEMYQFIHRCRVMGALTIDWRDSLDIEAMWNMRISMAAKDSVRLQAENDRLRTGLSDIVVACDRRYGLDAITEIANTAMNNGEEGKPC